MYFRSWLGYLPWNNLYTNMICTNLVWLFPKGNWYSYSKWNICMQILLWSRFKILLPWRPSHYILDIISQNICNVENTEQTYMRQVAGPEHWPSYFPFLEKCLWSHFESGKSCLLFAKKCLAVVLTSRKTEHLDIFNIR